MFLGQLVGLFGQGGLLEEAGAYDDLRAALGGLLAAIMKVAIESIFAAQISGCFVRTK